MNDITWKFPALYLSAVGIANIGGWVYLLAINLMVFEITGSALAVAGLYMIKPFAHMLVGLWAGSLIDRVSTKHLMITLDVVRASLLLMIPFIESIWIIYVVVLFIQLAGAIFEPASFTYMTMLLPEQDRKRFNALLSFVHSGAFVLGPALAGVLFMIGSLEMALFFNVAVFILSAGLISLLPMLVHSSDTGNRLTFRGIREDWRLVWNSSKIAFPFVVVYMAFQGVMLLTAALDSMEVAFAKEVLHLSNPAYGSLVSVAGIGFLIGAVCTNVLVRFTSAIQLMGSGTIMVAGGYVIYSFSTTYLMASTGFFILSFFLSLANTGFITFIQRNIPIEMMGRISSLYGMVAHTVQLLVVLFMGLAARWFTVQEVVISGSILMLIVALFLIVTVSRLFEQ
ncbi:MFS transporter [Paenisporosarcina sp. TG20]|uniref:MFS transporter n=1 Tax=Paenisporosarcina sp. TG20 TaxID=1211706 RepID=UPI0002EDA4FE|nr:MFS transporter [Paenisporosarcina sp. TG20]